MANDRVDPDLLPQTEPTPAPLFDSGPFPEPLETPEWARPADEVCGAEARDADEAPVPARSVVVPGQYAYLKRWKLALVVAAVWAPAIAIGLGLYYWWVALADKTPAVFVVLIYVVACTVGGLILAMVTSKPLVAALAIGVMTAMFASVAGAAPVYGHYFCQVTKAQGGRCLAGIIPY